MYLQINIKQNDLFVQLYLYVNIYHYICSVIKNNEILTIKNILHYETNINL